MSSDIHALSGAYAVDALDDLERAQFERHLAECDACQAEVRSLREATALLAEAVQQQPPTALRERVLAGIETVRPLPPVAPPGPPAATERRRRLLPLLVAAAVVAAVVGLGGGLVAWQPWQDETSQEPASAMERVMRAPDAESWTQRLDAGGKVTLARSEELNEAVIAAEGLPALSEEQVYEMWLLHDGVMVPAGVMEGDSGELVLEGDPATAQGAGITVEPAGGSEEPEGSPVLTFEFDQA